MKYVFVTGGVLSSVGKGTVCASIGKILQSRGFTVTAIKIDPYLNVDAGTMNPYMHGEVFVCEDGGEMDLDLGTYERFLDITMSKEANITTGQVYWTVINQERRGDFLGKCVQIIPHITDEIKRRIRQVAIKNTVDVVLIECGGTVGDIEALPFYEAFRQLRLEEGINNTVFTHVPLVPILVATKEQKSKPTQHSIQELRRIGLQPDLVVARCKTRSVNRNAVFTSPDVQSIYEIPLILDEQGLGNYICNRLNLPKKSAKWTSWRNVVHSLLKTDHELKIAICGKYAKLTDSYISINNALQIAGAVASAKVRIELIETEVFEEKPETLKTLSEFDGVLVPGGFGSRGTEGKIAAIEYAREKNIPFLGLCFGFQLAIVEFARNVCELIDANSTEINLDTDHPVIDLLPEQKNIRSKGATMRLGVSSIVIKPGTLAYRLYDADIIYERHRHRYEVSPNYISILTSQGLVFSGTTPDKIRMEILELPNHYFFLGTQYHPEFKSRPGKPDPAFYGFLKASLGKKLGIQHPKFDKAVSDNAEAKHLRNL
jgi:CTP synthase